MAVESVSSSSSAPVQQARQENQEVRRAERPSRPPENERPTETQEPKAKPTVNTSGQTVGSTISTSA